jgi:hypothetical protein
VHQELKKKGVTLTLLGSTFYPVLVHRLTVYVPRFLPTLGRPHAVALHFVRRDQLTAGCVFRAIVTGDFAEA